MGLIRKFYQFFGLHGIDGSKIASVRFLPRYVFELIKWTIKVGGLPNIFPVLTGYSSQAGQFDTQYFLQDLVVAQKIFELTNVLEGDHLDVGSRVDGFVAHVASFRSLSVLDVRGLDQLRIGNIRFVKKDLLEYQPKQLFGSISCLHVVEHIGLGRYGDQLEVDGWKKAVKRLDDLLAPNGMLFLSVPIASKSKVFFNAHRVFQPQEFLREVVARGTLEVIEVDVIDDQGSIHFDVSSAEDMAIIQHLSYGCMLVTAKKIR